MRHLPLLTLLIFLVSCGDQQIADPIDLASDQNYYPVELDRDLIYDLDSIVLVGTLRGVRYDTARSQVRERLVERYEAADGQTTYRGQRWQRADEASEWQFAQTFTVVRTETAVLRTEDNLTFTKLIFPITTNKSWDGNVAFDVTREVPVGGEFLDVYNNWNYRYEGEKKDTTINGIELADAQLVMQADVNNFIDLRRAYEKYAPGVGLVERFLDARHTQCRICCNVDLERCSALPWDEKAEKGYILHQTLREVN